MNAQHVVYLLINEGGWWGDDITDGMLQIIAPNETEPLVKRFSDVYNFAAKPWTIPENSALLLVYDDGQISASTVSQDKKDERYTKCRRTLHAVLPNNCKIRIFYHRRADFKTLKEIQDHFKANFWGCSDVMPTSKTLQFPWIAQIANAKANYNANARSYDELLAKFSSAWYTAFAYFHIEQPTRVTIESLFPLFVDLSNHEISPLSELEINAACGSAMKDLEANLSEIVATDEHSAIDLFKECFESIKKSTVSGPEQECAEASLELFSLLPNLTPTGHSIFKEKFRALSRAYSLQLGLGPVAPPSIPTTPETA